MLALGVALAGAVGAGLRWLADALLWRWRRGGFPWPIMLVNVVGCFAFAVLMGAGGPLVSGDAFAIVGAGLLGGFTTYSTVSVDAAELWRRRRYADAVGNAAGTLGLCAAAAFLGFFVGVQIPWFLV